MAPPPPPPPPKAAFSLYDNLLDPNDPAPPATISSAPVLYNQTSSVEARKPLDPALRFQPIRRPPVKQAKPVATFPKAIPTSAKSLGGTEAAVSSAPSSADPSSSSGPPAKSSLADWTATEEDAWKYGLTEKRQRGGRKKKKKRQNAQLETDWDEIYDPTRPTNIDEYLRSDEKIEEVREWKALLYRHRKRREDSDVSSDEDEADGGFAPPNQFAPPPSYAFAPPPPPPPQSQSPPPARAAPPAAVAVAAPPPPEESAEDAYARRMALSSKQQPPRPAPPSPPPQSNVSQPSAPSTDSATISRAPIRYTTQPLQSPSHDHEDKDEDEASSSGPIPGANDDGEDQQPHPNQQEPQPRSNRPGQSGFAQRLMNKYGWTKGSGLGADQSGIVNPLRIQVEKRRKKADADGGGWAGPGGKGKIIGSKRKEEGGKFGTMSDVIVLRNMLENMPDLQAEIADGLGQEIGEECGEKYGRVERLHIDPTSRQVFIKFTTQVSALRAVNELDGRNFNGNNIAPRFYDSERFDAGVYDAL
ncbi:hypothetical protein E4U42_002283 [Claviceps africana]|uniref:G-patch domain-containing protein n=1 Tax=Claviceps africana TaxID=83212 RepID=A0A8K0JEF7_9HYPO|nr:hypothetical protein E4U42_002283 [Claviceps africana]